MASEDSDQVMPGCLPVHRFGDFRDINETAGIKMPIVSDHSHAARKLLKVTLLRRPKGMSFKERNYRSHKVLPSVHDELAQMLAVVVVALVDVDTTHAEEAPQLLKRRSAANALRHDKPMRNLVPSFVASAVLSTWLPNKPDGEATLSVHKASDPTNLNQSFLLIVCTHSIFTVPPTWDGTRSLRYTDIPAFGRMRTARLPARGATIHLRTVPAVTTRTLSSKRSAHFWPTLMVAHESGLSHPVPGLGDRLGV
jgi:hypothetical protein